MSWDAKRLLSLMVLILFPSVTRGEKSASGARVSYAQAAGRICEYISYVEERTAAMSSLYEWDKVVDEMKYSFQSHGVTGAAMRNAETWGINGVYLPWRYVYWNFYAHHLDALRNSLATVALRGYARPVDLDYLDNGMQTWKSIDAQIAEVFADVLEVAGQAAHAYEQESKAKQRPDRHLFQLVARQAGATWSLLADRAKEIADQRIFSALRPQASGPGPVRSLDGRQND